MLVWGYLGDYSTVKLNKQSTYLARKIFWQKSKARFETRKLSQRAQKRLKGAFEGSHWTNYNSYVFTANLANDI